MPQEIFSSHRLYCFHHVALAGSFRDASRRLGIAQSALSRHVQSLESELGMVLLHRGRDRVTVTEAGEVLLARVGEMLSTFDGIRDDMDGLRGQPRGRVTLALPASFATAYLGRIVPPFLESCPQVLLRVLEGSAMQIEELLLAGKADVGIVVATEQARHLTQEHLMSDGLYLVGRRPLPGRPEGPCPIEALRGLPLVLPLAPFGTRRVIDEVARRHNVTLSPVLEADSPHILKLLVMNRDLYTIMPGISFAQEREAGTLRGVELSPRLERRLAVATVTGRATSLAARILAQHVRSVFVGSSSPVREASAVEQAGDDVAHDLVGTAADRPKSRVAK